MNYNIISGLPIKCKYGGGVDIRDVLCNDEIKSFFNSTGYSSRRYPMANEDFKEFLVGENGLFTVTADTEDEGNNAYIDGDGYNTQSGKELAGTLFTYSAEQKDEEGDVVTGFSFAYLIEKTYDADENLYSSVDIKVNYDNPLMQSIVDCSGVVHDFKRGVTLADFSKYIDSTTDSTYPEFVTLKGIAPSNCSKSKRSANNENIIIPPAKYETVQSEEPTDTHYLYYLILLSTTNEEGDKKMVTLNRGFGFLNPVVDYYGFPVRIHNEILTFSEVFFPSYSSLLGEFALSNASVDSKKYILEKMKETQ